MPIPWLTVLKAVPWTEVISNAPKVANGARKLWDSIGNKQVEAVDGGSDKSAQPMTLPEVEAELARQRAAVADLQQQMQASSELIASLAEQNAQLIARVDENRRRLRQLLVGLLATAALGLAALWMASGT
ncbi:MAG TPA: hypothetical protein VIS73_12165 [Rhodocyclaceae bacterium]